MPQKEFEEENAQYRLVTYTEEEELANRVTHAVGALLSVVGLFLLVYRTAPQGDPWRLVSCTLYGATLLVFYTVSTVYHTVQRPWLKYLFRVLDHAGIFLVIAGTYTPFTLVSLKGASVGRCSEPSGGCPWPAPSSSR